MDLRDFENSLHSSKPEISYRSVLYLFVYVSSFINLAMPDWLPMLQTLADIFAFLLELNFKQSKFNRLNF